MDIGAHCSVPACHQQDFLPFTCDCCSGVFCLEHRTYDSHECPKAGSNDRRVVQCPVCKQMIRWTAEQDVNAVWEEHVRVGQCTREKFKQQQIKQQKKPKKKRCAAQNCREVLLTSNQFHCNKCAQDVCLKHRFEADHDCEAKRQTQRQQWLGGFKARSTTSQFQKNAQNAAASVVSGTKSAVSSLVQNAKAASGAVTASSEECPMCQQKFAYPVALAAPRGVPAGSEVCPQCRAIFPNVNALIQHAETAHTGAVAVGRAGGTGGDQEKCTIM
ncbi:Zinc finger, C2H2 [Phytophthora cactorum]|nr:Zinc finger, C2H2 [Phytophthora cactorum]